MCGACIAELVILGMIGGSGITAFAFLVRCVKPNKPPRF